MSLALYRKYRPQKFSDIIGQEHIKITLEREVAANKVAHAYLFSGPRGTGKTSIARILAKAVNCETRNEPAQISAKQKLQSDKGEPCNECAACKTITEGRALDVIEIDAASYTGVENVRETIVETAKFAPSSLKFKIFIIDEAHMLSPSAWNALLKIMEEPPKHVLFVLATTEARKVPATIISRCQHFAFHRVVIDELVKRLESIAAQEKINITKPVLDIVARQSEGCVRDAESVLEQLFSLGAREITEDAASLVLPRTSLSAILELVAILQTNNTQSGLELVNRLMEQGIDLARFTEDLLIMLRNILIMKITGDNAVSGLFDTQTFKQLLSRVDNFDVARVLNLIDKFTKARQDFRNAVIPQLPLEIAIIESCGYDIRPTLPPVNLDNKGSSASVATEAELPVVVTIEQIKSKWAELISRAQLENSSLPFLLSTGYPVEVSGDTLRIGVRYAMHCDKLNEHKCRSVLENLLADIYKFPLKVRGIITDPPKKKGDDIENVLQTFGGRLVD